LRLEKFSPKQLEILKFICEDYDTLICDGAVRSGKTVVMIVAYIVWAMYNFDRCNFAICAKTVGNAEKNILNPLMSIEGLPYEMNYRRSDKLFTVKCGKKENYFYIYGGRDESSYSLIQGITLAGVFFDEVALMPKSFADQAVSRTLTYESAKLWFNCNPESPAHWFYEEYIKNQKKNTKRLHFLMSDNPIMTPKKIRAAESRFSGVFYDRYVKGLWVVAEGLVYKNFDEDIHVTESVPDSGAYYISVDYGTLNPCSMGLWCVSGEVAYRVKEFYHDGRKTQRQLTDEEYYEKLENLAEGYNVECIIVDPSAASFIATIKKHGRFSVKRARNDVINGINCTSSLITAGKLKIHKSCRDILNEFKVYRYDETASEDRVIKENDHAMDDMRYFCYTILNRMW